MKKRTSRSGWGRTGPGAALVLLAAAGCSRDEGPGVPPAPAGPSPAVDPAPPVEDASAAVLAAVKDLLAAQSSAGADMAARVEEWKLPEATRWIEASFEPEPAAAMVKDYDSVMAKMSEAMLREVEQLAKVTDLEVSVQRYFKGSEVGAPPRLRRGLRSCRDGVSFYVVRFKRGQSGTGRGVWVVVMAGGKPRMFFHEVER